MVARSVCLEPRAQDQLAACLARELTQIGMAHYRQLGAEQLRERAASLVAAFCRALANDDGGSFVAFVGRVTVERISEGYHLDEMLIALRVLEEEAWKILAAESSGPPEGAHLCQIARLVGAAKDQIARVYLAEKQRAESRVEQLQRQLDQLFKGTVSPPSYEDVEDEPPAREVGNRPSARIGDR